MKVGIVGSGFVDVKRLRIEFRSESLNLLFGDPQSTGAERLSHRKVFEISPAHSR